MAGIRFLLQEVYISSGLLAAVLVSYIVFLVTAQVCCRGASLLLRFFAFLQMLALSSVPFVLTLLERQGLTAEGTGVRLIEELCLHTARYGVIIRPLMGYIGVFIDMITFRFVSTRSNDQYTYNFSNVHNAACKRASSPINSSWIRIFTGESGPITAWIRFERTKRQVLQTLTRAGQTRTDFGVVAVTPRLRTIPTNTSLDTPGPVADNEIPPLYVLPQSVIYFAGSDDELPPVTHPSDTSSVVSSSCAPSPPNSAILAAQALSSSLPSTAPSSPGTPPPSFPISSPPASSASQPSAGPSGSVDVLPI